MADCTMRSISAAAARRADPGFAANTGGVELLLQEAHRTERGVAAKDVLYRPGFARDNEQLVVSALVSERRDAAHPHPLLLRGGDLVADTLAGDLALELRKGQQNIEGQTPHRRRRVELLRDRNKGRASRIKDFDDLGKISQRAGQPVDLVDNDRIDPTRRDVGEQPLQSRPIDRLAGEPAGGITCTQANPALVPRAGDEGLAGRALR